MQIAVLRFLSAHFRLGLALFSYTCYFFFAYSCIMSELFVLCRTLSVSSQRETIVLCFLTHKNEIMRAVTKRHPMVCLSNGSYFVFSCSSQLAKWNFSFQKEERIPLGILCGKLNHKISFDFARSLSQKYKVRLKDYILNEHCV